MHDITITMMYVLANFSDQFSLKQFIVLMKRVLVCSNTIALLSDPKYKNLVHLASF